MVPICKDCKWRGNRETTIAAPSGSFVHKTPLCLRKEGALCGDERRPGGDCGPNGLLFEAA